MLEMDKTGNARINVNVEAPSRNHCCRRRGISITYSTCVSVALIIQQAKRMRGVLLPSVACPDLPYFSTLILKRHDFRGENVWKTNVCFDFLQKLFLKYFLLEKNSAR